MLPIQEPASVCLVTGAQKASDRLRELIPPERFSPLTAVFSAGEARRQLLDSPADLVVINTPLPDEFGVQLAMELAENETMGVLLLVKSELYEQTAFKTEGSGILTLEKPLERQLFLQTLRLLAVTAGKLKRLSQRAETLQTKMDEIRLVNRAKLLLIEQLKMTEAEAHRYIEKSAMDRCVRRREIAENIIKTYES